MNKTFVMQGKKMIPARVEQIDGGEFDKETGKYSVSTEDGTMAVGDTVMEAADMVTAQLNRRR